MGVFCYKKIPAHAPLYERFAAARAERGFSLSEIATRTHIPVKYLVALETGDYTVLPPSRPYRTAYIRELAATLEFDVKLSVRQFAREGGLRNLSSASHPLTGVHMSRFASLSMLARNIGLGLAAFLFVCYLGWQVRGVLEPPKLLVYAPLEGGTSTDQTILVQGETNPETQLTINGQNVVVTNNGSFETRLDATDGLDTITISATKKHGKTTTITRHVVVRPKIATLP